MKLILFLIVSIGLATYYAYKMYKLFVYIKTNVIPDDDFGKSIKYFFVISFIILGLMGMYGITAIVNNLFNLLHLK